MDDGQHGIVKVMLRQMDPLQLLQQTYPERYDRICALLAGTGSAEDLYGEGRNKAARRSAIAADLCTVVSVMPPSRLLRIIEQSVLWQQEQGLLQPGLPYNLVKDAAGRLPELVTTELEIEDALPKTCIAMLNFGRKRYAEAVAFSPSATYMATGTLKGLIQVWNPLTGDLATDLPYQRDENWMIMDDGILALAFSKDGLSLASGSVGGQLMVWRVETGQCLRRFPAAHTDGLTHVRFTDDATKLLTASHDLSLRIHGIRSGSCLSEFHGHTSFVNVGIFSNDARCVLSGSSDGTVRVCVVVLIYRVSELSLTARRSGRRKVLCACTS